MDTFRIVGGCVRYKRFVIKNYRAIRGPLEIRMDKGLLLPVIGVNESGKTTILQAIFAFDHFNDELNDDGRHLKDVSNLYHSTSVPAMIEAEVETSPKELRGIFGACGAENPNQKVLFQELGRRKKLPSKLRFCRDLATRKYSILSEYFGDSSIQNLLGHAFVRYLPYILYFDDFRDKIAERIEIPAKADESTGEWFEILEQLFKQTDKSFSLFDLPALEVRHRKTVLAKVQRHLNNTLTREWQSFRLDDRDALKISLEFEQKEATQLVTPKGTLLTALQTPQPQPVATQVIQNYVKLEVVETDEHGDEHFFFISDRSKGFYWFFNFVMKLEFNPKVNADSAQSVYLLDEPGSYLHAYAQRKLCHKLRQLAEKNDVIYCTHSHYLLDPAIIPINSVTVADKDGNGDVTLTRLIDYRGDATPTRSALQPLLDALEIRPYALDLLHTQATILAEGMYDYFCLEIFRGDRSVSILPCTGAESIKFYVPLMIGWQLKFRALWDNDPEGRKRHDQAATLFGEQIAKQCFRILPFNLAGGNCIMQNLFEGPDLVRLREGLGLAQDCSFERTILALFYSTEREKLLHLISQETKTRFEDVYRCLDLPV